VEKDGEEVRMRTDRSQVIGQLKQGDCIEAEVIAQEFAYSSFKLLPQVRRAGHKSTCIDPFIGVGADATQEGSACSIGG